MFIHTSTMSGRGQTFLSSCGSQRTNQHHHSRLHWFVSLWTCILCSCQWWGWALLNLLNYANTT